MKKPLTLKDKQDLMQQLQQHFLLELENLEKSAQSAAEAATHTENKPEHKYDTRGLEASYLAGAQKERALEIRGALSLLQALPVRLFAQDAAVAVTALIELSEGDRSSLCLLVPMGAGYRLKWNEGEVTTITVQSPLGKLLLHKHEGDVVVIQTAQGKKEYEIISVQ